MQPYQEPLLLTSLNELQLQSNLHCGHRGFVPLLFAVEHVSLAVRFHASLQSRLGFSAMSRGSAPSLIPLIGCWPPGSPAAGEFRSHSHFPVSLFIHKSGARYRPEPTRRGAPDSPAGGGAAECASSGSSAHGQPMR